MNLIIDVGNSYTKVALIEGDSIVHVHRFESLGEDEICRLIQDHSPTRAIASIVGKVNGEAIRLVKDSMPTIELNSKTPIPITNLYETPETLGYDRLAAAIGANYLYPGKNLLVIDSGTALTYDFIDCYGRYIGGAISPGIGLRFRALNNYTSKLPLLRIPEEYKLIGVNTKECIEAGVINGVLSEVDGYIDRVKREHPGVLTLITGGDANFFVNKLKNSIFVNQNLVITGLNRILEFNV
jgi:type III pantothenate kinase